MVIIVTNFFTLFTLLLLTNFQENHICFTTVCKKSHTKYNAIPSNDRVVNYRSQAEERTEGLSEGQAKGRAGGREFSPCNPSRFRNETVRMEFKQIHR